MRCEILRSHARLDDGPADESAPDVPDSRRIVAVITLTGEFDIADRQTLDRALSRALHGRTAPRDGGAADADTWSKRDEGDQSALASDGATTLVVDCAGITYIDCACLGVLIRTAHEARSTGSRLLLHRPSRPVQRLLTLLHLDPANLAPPTPPCSRAG